jgi:hypothetical protein
MNYRDAEARHARCNDILLAAEKKYETVKRQIEVQLEAFSQIPRNLNDNSGFRYYTSEREKVSKKLDEESGRLQRDISTLEAKKQAAIEAIEADYRDKITRLENKRDAAVAAIEAEARSKISIMESKSEQFCAKLQGDADRLTMDIERVQSKLECPEPQTPAYRKLKADLGKSEEEMVEAKKRYIESNAELLKAFDRHQDRLRQENAEKERAMMREQAIRDEEAMKRIEHQRENERKAEDERAAMRLKEALAAMNTPTEIVPTPVVKTPPPPPAPKKKEKVKGGVKLSFPLNAKTKYSYNDLCDMELNFDYDTLSQQDEELHSKLMAYAARRENIKGWQSNRHNIDDHGYTISEEDFEAFYKGA